MVSIFCTGSEKTTPVRPCTRAPRSSSASASGRMSAGRARNAGTGIVSTLRRKNKSSRNCPSETRRARSALVSAIRRASIVMVSVPPSRSNCRSSSTRKSFDWVAGESAATSSSTMVPAPAISSRPSLRSTAPVKAPRSWPNNSDSTSSCGRLAQSIFKKGRVAPRAEFVDQARQMILARAAFPGDEQRGGSFRDFARQIDEPPSRRDLRRSTAMRGSLIPRPPRRRAMVRNSPRETLQIRCAARRARGARDRKNGARAR